MTFDLLSVIIHDTFVIAAVSDDVLCLFECEREWLIGKDIFALIPSDDFKALARLRMTLIRERERMKPQELPMERPDGTIFWITVQTTRIGKGYWWSTIQYIGDHYIKPKRFVK